ncbi:ankyrin-3-like [Lineus longissimus]|uniref:ankyrin-3-like n=1 Tax=Lineus longissimus TaxID=88925 RepID=UPI002B4E41DA
MQWSSMNIHFQAIFYYNMDTDGEGETMERYGLTLLSQAAWDGNDNTVQELIEKGASIETKDFKGNTSLILAIYQGHSSIVQVLLDKGAGIETKGSNDWSPIHFASNRGYENTVKLLLDRGAEIETRTNNGFSPLSIASENGHENVVELLLDQGANIESKDNSGFSPLALASENGRSGVVKLLLGRGAEIEAKTLDGFSPLSLASQNGHEDIVNILLDSGANLESKGKGGFSPLCLAVQDGHEKVAEVLLDKGAEIEAKTKSNFSPLSIASLNRHENVVKLLLDRGASIESAENSGFTPLCLAAQSGNENIVKLLLDSGADIETKINYGYSVLTIASQNGHENVVKLLLDRGANTESKGAYDWCPIFEAIFSGHTGIVLLLLEFEANIESRDSRGRSPLSVAASIGKVDIVDILLKDGADYDSKDEDAVSALDNGIIHGQVDVVECFLKHITKKGDLGTIVCEKLSLAAKHGQKDVILCIMKLGNQSDLDYVDRNGCSPLAEAISQGQLDCVRYLQSLGATLSFVGDDKLIQCLSRCWSLDMYQYLLVAGLNPLAVDNSGHKVHDYVCYGEYIDWDVFKTLSPATVDGRPRKVTATSLVTYPGLGSVRALPYYIRRDLTQTILKKVSSITEQARNFYKLSFEPIGSSVESTKVGLTDEFDFMLQSSSNIVIVDELFDVGHGYIRYDEANRLSNSSKVFHNNVWFYMESKDDMLISAPPATAGEGTASTPIKMRYQKEATDQSSLMVSVDLVPVLQVKDWPSDAIQRTWMMTRNDLRARGYQLVARPPHRDSEFGKTFEESERERLYRVTFSKLEVEHIRNLPDRVKDAYILAKCLRSPVVCRVVVQDDDGVIYFVDKFITSYLLKTVFMHNVDEFLVHQRPLVEMAYILYCQLEYYLSHGFLPLFWMQKVNLLEGVNINAAKSHKVAAHMKAHIGKLYHEELGKEPPVDLHDTIEMPPDCQAIDLTVASGIEILCLPLKQ